MTPEERAHAVMTKWQAGSPFDPLEEPIAQAIRAAVEDDRAVYRRICETVGMVDGDQGRYRYPEPEQLCRLLEEMVRMAREHTDERIPMRRDTWHEDDGPALWWKFPVVEPPYAGTPLDDDFPGFVTHWTRLPEPFEPMMEER